MHSVALMAGVLSALMAFAGLKPAVAAAPSKKPNIVLILADDMGFSDIGCYGGEISTPNLDKLAGQGIRFTQFYNAARCCPSRATLMTGLYAHQAHVGDMVDEYARKMREDLGSDAYSDHLNPNVPTIAEALNPAGYRTCMSGKWHLGYRTNEWPFARGFDRAFGVIEGAMNYYGFGMQHTGVITNPPMALDGKVFIPPREGFFATDTFTDFATKFIKESSGGKQPFFLYLAYTAPHWPLQARAETIAKYRGTYKAMGWDKLREERFKRLKASGIVDSKWVLAPRPQNVRRWEDATPARQDEWDNQMAVYAAQVDELDQAIGRVLETLRQAGAEQNTLVMFMSDNGGAAEDPNRSLPGSVLGTRESFKGYGIGGAHISSSPFRKTKKYSHEGGIATPLIIRWPAGLPKSSMGALYREPAHFIDLMPTCLELGGARYPGKWNDVSTPKLEGVSLLPALALRSVGRTTPLFWEHEGHRAIRDGKWKLVASHNDPWELYDMEADRTETHDLAKENPAKVAELLKKYEAWTARAGVKPWP